MHISFLFIWMVVVLLGLSAVFALAWAIATGQFSNFDRGARCIFDADEPVGEVTDRFPGGRSPR